MGAWGIHFDECDGALDFLGDLEDNRDWARVEAQIANARSEDGYEQGEETLAAAELVAAALGKGSPRLDSGHRDWAVQYSAQAQALREQALAAARYVMDESELAELWNETDEAATWRASVSDLAARLDNSDV